MAGGDIKAKYGTTATFTVTNLHSLAASSSRVAGWTSASVDNTSDLALDYLLGLTFTTHASNRQAGQIDIWAYGAFNPTGPVWPDLFSSGTEGTEGAATIHDTEERDSGLVLLDSVVTDDSASAVYTRGPRGLAAAFDSMTVPPLWALFIAHNIATSTNAGLASSGSAIYRTPVLAQYT
jgi:hypothetical protein